MVIVEVEHMGMDTTYPTVTYPTLVDWNCIRTVVEGGYKGKDIEPTILWISKIWIHFCLSVSMFWTLPRYIIFKSIAISYLDR